MTLPLTLLQTSSRQASIDVLHICFVTLLRSVGQASRQSGASCRAAEYDRGLWPRTLEASSTARLLVTRGVLESCVAGGCVLATQLVAHQLQLLMPAALQQGCDCEAVASKSAANLLLGPLCRLATCGFKLGFQGFNLNSVSCVFANHGNSNCVAIALFDRCTGCVAYVATVLGCIDCNAP